MQTCQSSTNAVESHNRLSKEQQPEILKVAMLTTYTKLIWLALWSILLGLRESQQVMECAKVSKKKHKGYIDEDDGPPDKRRHFEQGRDYLSVVKYAAIDIQNGMLPVEQQYVNDSFYVL